MKCLGASGAVTAVLVLFALHYPNYRLYLWFLFPIPIWILVLVEVGQDLMGLLSGNPGPTAVAVHLGGAAFAFLYHKAQWRVLNLLAGLQGLKRYRMRSRLRVYRGEPARPATTAAPVVSADADEHLEAKLDAVLEKVARHGQDSLTDSERQILVRASEIYRRRRS